MSEIRYDALVAKVEAWRAECPETAMTVPSMAEVEGMLTTPPGQGIEWALDRLHDLADMQIRFERQVANGATPDEAMGQVFGSTPPAGR